MLKKIKIVVMGPGLNFLTWVRSAIYGLCLNLENFPLKTSNFSNFFPSGQKKSLRVGKYPGSDGSRSKIFDPGRVNFLWLGSGRVSHLLFGFEFQKIPLEMSNFSNFFPAGQKKLLQVGSESTRVKAGSASYLLRVKSKLRSGRVRAHL